MNFEADDLRFLREMTRDVVEASRVRPGERVGDSAANTLGHVLIRPGGRDCYPAAWVRDFSMALDSGFVTPDEALQHLRLFLSRQNGPQPRKLASGAVIPPFAIPDHVNFDGGAVFYPGTMSAGDDQGGEPFGLLPPIDDHYEIVHLAHHVLLATGDATFLRETIHGMTTIERLVRAFDAPRTDAATGGMVATAPADRAVGFGFCDTVYLTGAILFPSLLRYRAAMELVRLGNGLGTEVKPEAAKIAASIGDHVARIFADPAGSGWLLAATDVGRRPDVWGTLFALHLRMLAPADAAAARNAVLTALDDGTIALDAALRHVPTTHDASPTSAWDRVAWDWKVNTYQNGAYWHVPTGWLISALHRHEPVRTRKLLAKFVAHLREQDFRRGEDFGAPWECFGRDGAARQNPVYLASVALPLGVVQQLEG